MKLLYFLILLSLFGASLASHTAWAATDTHTNQGTQKTPATAPTNSSASKPKTVIITRTVTETDQDLAVDKSIRNDIKMVLMVGNRTEPAPCTSTAIVGAISMTSKQRVCVCNPAVGGWVEMNTETPCVWSDEPEEQPAQ